MLGIADDRGHACRGLGDLRDPVLEPPESGSSRHGGQFKSVAAAFDHVDGGVAPVGEFHQTALCADDRESIDNCHGSVRVVVVDQQSMGLPEVGQLSLDQVRPATELCSDTSGLHVAGEFAVPVSVTVRRCGAFGFIQACCELLADRFEEAVSKFAVDVLADDQAGVFEFFERVDNVEFVDVVIAGDGLGGVEGETSDHDGESRPRRVGRLETAGSMTM